MSRWLSAMIYLESIVTNSPIWNRTNQPRNLMIAASSPLAIARWTFRDESMRASVRLFMFPHSIRTFGIVVRFRPARSLRKK